MITTITSTFNAFINAGNGFSHPLKKKSFNFFRTTFSILNRQERRRFGVLMLADSLVSVIDIVSLAFLLLIIQFYVQPEKSFPFSFLPEWMLNRDSVSLVALFFMVFAIKNLVAFFIAKAQHRFNGKVAVRISKDSLVNYQQSSFEDYVHIDTSVHLRKIAYQPYDFCQYMLSGIQQIITQSSLIIISIIAILLFNTNLFLLLLIILVPPVLVVFYFIKKRLTKAKWFIRKGNEKSFQYLMDALKGYVEGNIYGRNDFFLHRFVEQRKNFSLHLFDSMSIQTLPSRLIEIFAVMGLFILVVIAQWTGGDNASLITIGAFMVAAYRIIPGLVKLVNITSQIKAFEFSLNELVHDDVKSNVVQKKHTDSIQTIRFDNVHFAYTQASAISNLSFDIYKGDFVGITGRSGKGKTTVLNLLLGFLEPSQGEIFVNNSVTTKSELQKYWPSIAYVRQQPFFIHDSVLKNITLQEHDHNEEKLTYAVNTSGLKEFLNYSTDGINRMITENGKNISGGQQQRISLARAVYKDADVILLDEPFNELDEASELFLLNHFSKLAKSGKIVIMVTHNKKALSFCNKIVSLDDQ